MPVYVNRAHVYTLTTGTGSITLGTPVLGFQSFASAGVANGNVVSYTIEDTGNAWEVGVGTYSSTGPTLTRTLVQSSTGALLNLTGAARVYVIQSADNMTNLSLGDGTAALPSVSFNSDPDTGVFDASANTLGFSTGGSERFRIGPTGQIGIGGANYGTSGQVLTSGGSGAAPSWLPANGMTLLGTLATTSGTTQTLSSLDLTGYKAVFFTWNNVSLSANAVINLGGVAATDNLGTTLTNVITGWGILVLATGNFLSNGRTNAGITGSAAASWNSGITTITNASTSITIAPASGSFDAGSVSFYGMR